MRKNKNLNSCSIPISQHCAGKQKLDAVYELTGRIIATLPKSGNGKCNRDDADSLLNDFNSLHQMMSTMSVLTVSENFPDNKNLSCIRLLQGKINTSV